MKYLGIDFAPNAVAWARENTRKPRAEFLARDFLGMEPPGIYDTVVAFEVLEHLEEPSELADLMLKCARRRIVVTVPVSMKCPEHLHPEWSCEDLEALFGELALCREYQAKQVSRILIGVIDVDEQQQAAFEGDG